MPTSKTRKSPARLGSSKNKKPTLYVMHTASYIRKNNGTLIKVSEYTKKNLERMNQKTEYTKKNLKRLNHKKQAKKNTINYRNVEYKPENIVSSNDLQKSPEYYFPTPPSNYLLPISQESKKRTPQSKGSKKHRI